MAFRLLTKRVNKPRNKIILFSSGVIQFVVFVVVIVIVVVIIADRIVFDIGNCLRVGSVRSSIAKGNKGYFFLRNSQTCFTAPM